MHVSVTCSHVVAIPSLALHRQASVETSGGAENELPCT